MCQYSKIKLRHTEGYQYCIISELQSFGTERFAAGSARKAKLCIYCWVLRVQYGDQYNKFFHGVKFFLVVPELLESKKAKKLVLYLRLLS